jgi:hypothetical protein
MRLSADTLIQNCRGYQYQSFEHFGRPAAAKTRLIEKIT